MPSYPSGILRCILETIQTWFCLSTPVSVGETVTREIDSYNEGEVGTIPEGWISVTLINQGTLNVVVDSTNVLFPGTSISWDLKGLPNRGDEIDFTVNAGAGSEALIVLVVR